MPACKVCGFHNLDSRSACLKCGAALRAPVPSGRGSPRAAPFAPPDFLFRIRRAAARLGRFLGRRLAVPLPVLPHRFPFLAGCLGLLPGLGQIYNRQPAKLLVLLPVWFLGIALAARFLSVPWWGNLSIAAVLLVSVFSFADALVTAVRINGRFLGTRDRLAVLTYPVFLGAAACFLLSLLAWMNCPVLTLFSVGSAALRPGIEPGDRILGEALTYWFRDPRPGEVVRCDPPGYSVEVGPDVYRINPRNAWERVLAVEGETLERRHGDYFVDGKKLSRAYGPLAEEAGIFRDFKITCPPGCVIVPVSYLPEDNGLVNRLAGVGRAPTLNDPGNIVVGWEAACCLKRRYVEAGVLKRGFLDRAVLIYHPSVRRRWLQSRGPRFETGAP